MGGKTEGASGLKAWTDLIGSLPEALRAKFHPAEFRLVPDADYGALSGLDEWHSEAGLFYFKAGRLALIHLHGAAELAGLDGERLLADLGGSPATLPSRAGKGFGHHVFPERGLAFSSDSAGRVAYLEIFRPMSLDDYRARIFVDPGSFVR